MRSSPVQPPRPWSPPMSSPGSRAGSARVEDVSVPRVPRVELPGTREDLQMRPRKPQKRLRPAGIPSRRRWSPWLAGRPGSRGPCYRQTGPSPTRKRVHKNLHSIGGCLKERSSKQAPVGLSPMDGWAPVSPRPKWTFFKNVPLQCSGDVSTLSVSFGWTLASSSSPDRDEMDLYKRFFCVCQQL